ncbi:MAG: ATP-binding cassette domain-containing protein [Betaproteobacteria bacterium]|nr:ATP-binding cassette domain-containing protein [Betaproteobacteria bacterium]
MSALLSVRAVNVRFDGVTALSDISFDALRGELLGLIGPNGAGKTTLLRVITGVVRPATGTVLLDGVPLDRLPTHARIRRGLALSQQIVTPFRGMTMLDNVALAAGTDKTTSPVKALIHRRRDAELAAGHRLLARLRIDGAAAELPEIQPLGVLKRLELARALALKPKLLLLDEPLAGLNSSEARLLADTIAEINSAGTTVILIEHNLSEVLRVCTRLVVLDNGRKIAEGAPAAVMNDRIVRAAYLGPGADAQPGERHVAA